MSAAGGKGRVTGGGARWRHEVQGFAGRGALKINVLHTLPAAPAVLTTLPLTSGCQCRMMSTMRVSFVLLNVSW